MEEGKQESNEYNQELIGNIEFELPEDVGDSIDCIVVGAKKIVEIGQGDEEH